MVRAHILVECEPGEIAPTTQALENLEGVEQADATLGPYDVVVIVQKEDLEELGNFVTQEVQSVPGVKGTTTCLSVQL